MDLKQVQAHTGAVVAAGRRKELEMDRGKQSFRGWGLEEWIGASVVLAIAAGIAITIWPGWTAVGGWL
jgi:hypothetical protein